MDKRVSVYAPGTSVELKLPDDEWSSIIGKVNAVQLSGANFDRRLYLVAWWKDGERKENWFDDHELGPCDATRTVLLKAKESQATDART